MVVDDRLTTGNNRSGWCLWQLVINFVIICINAYWSMVDDPLIIAVIVIVPHNSICLLALAQANKSVEMHLPSLNHSSRFQHEKQTQDLRWTRSNSTPISGQSHAVCALVNFLLVPIIMVKNGNSNPRIPSSHRSGGSCIQNKPKQQQWSNDHKHENHHDRQQHHHQHHLQRWRPPGATTTTTSNISNRKNPLVMLQVDRACAPLVQDIVLAVQNVLSHDDGILNQSDRKALRSDGFKHKGTTA